MKKLIFAGLVVAFFSLNANAQGTDEPFFNLRKFYTQSNYGTARSQAMGGAFTALGGDLSNAYINPAGLGFYNRSEMSGTFNFLASKTKASYIQNETTTNRSPLELGQLGVVFSNDGTGSRIRKGNLALSYNTLNNFNHTFQFSGSNNSSSISDSFVELANGSGLTPEAIAADYEKYKNAPNGYSMAVMGGLVYYDNGKYVVNEVALPVAQSGTVVEDGNLGQINVSYGVNFDDDTYLGAGLGIQTLRFTRATSYDEKFPSGSKFLESLYYDNQLSITGTGLNLTFGVIQRLNDNFNLGASIATPTLMWIQDSFYQNGGVKAVQPDVVLYNTSAETANDQFNYRVVSPLKANIGVSAFLPNKIGVVSAEMEYVGYSRMGIKDKTDKVWSDSQNGMIQDEYKDVLNFKGGIELRKGIGRIRGGINYIKDPLRYPGDYNAQKDYVIGSTGIGIRNSRFFADLSYSGFINTGTYNPYILGTNEHYSVTYRQAKNTVGITIGSFF